MDILAGTLGLVQYRRELLHLEECQRQLTLEHRVLGGALGVVLQKENVARDALDRRHEERRDRVEAARRIAATLLEEADERRVVLVQCADGVGGLGVVVDVLAVRALEQVL